MTKLPRTAWEWAVLVRVIVILAAIRRMLPRVPLPELMERLTPRRTRAQRRTFDAGVRYADALLARYPIGARGDCLPRSLVIYHLARRAGMPARLHCGVRLTDPGIDGHAWCTSRGVVLAGARDEGFIETYRFPGVPA